MVRENVSCSTNHGMSFGFHELWQQSPLLLFPLNIEFDTIEKTKRNNPTYYSLTG
jgi:hypothetical protein